MEYATSSAWRFLKGTFSPSPEVGFTLIELLVVIVMLGVLLVGLLFIFDPIHQINKAKDLDRQHNLEQIKSALDTYYNDTGCYPTSLNFGSAWKVGTTVYMTKLPQDPDYINGSVSNLPYYYQTDGTNCPQWDVLYAGLRATPNSSIVACPLAQRVECLPQGFNSYYNVCLPSGSVDCSVVAGSSLPVGTGGGSGSGGSGGGGSTTPAPTPTPYVVVCPDNNYYGCTGADACNSQYPKEGKCYGYGGTVQCYCDSFCRVNGIKQCAN